MKSLLLPPSAPVLLESMRAIGYDPAAAVADIVDNSIAAEAARVQILFEPGRPESLAILDDGSGMTQPELEVAMRHGSRSPLEVRAENDLGRFGLGLKTASLSQCRRLTVLSRKNGHTSGLVWDLDLVAKAKDWVVGVLEKNEIKLVPYFHEFSKVQTGTLVVWQNLDLIAAGDPGDGSVLSDRMKDVADHLARVFHRFLSGHPPELRLEINGGAVVPLDPFLEDEGSEAGPEELFSVEGVPILLRAYTLPHISRLSRVQIEKAGGEYGLRREQGFYVYRNRRLLVWGTWFRLHPQEELTKLTRVRVDVPNSLDRLWSLDIKKSTATPPPIIRERLRGLVPTMAKGSRHAHQYRGSLTVRKGIRPVWNRIDDRDGVRYEIDADHPVIEGLRRSLTLDDGLATELGRMLRAISMSLPVEALYNDRANDRIGHRKEDSEDNERMEELECLARQMIGAFESRNDRQKLLERLTTIEPFAFFPQAAERIRARLSE